MQEKSVDVQAELDSIRAQRATEDKERKAREQELNDIRLKVK